MIGNRLRVLREEHGLSQKDLAKKLGKSQETISSWENNRTVPKMKQLKELCDLYDCTYESLTGIKQHNASDITLNDIMFRLNDFDIEELEQIKHYSGKLIVQKKEMIELKRKQEELESRMQRLMAYHEQLTRNPSEGV